MAGEANSKLTIKDLVGKIQEVGEATAKVASEMVRLERRNEYMILRTESLLRAILSVDHLPNLESDSSSPCKPPISPKKSKLKKRIQKIEEEAGDLFDDAID